MEYDQDSVDEMVLALLYLTNSHDQYGTRAWKGLDWGVMDRLYQKGYTRHGHKRTLTNTANSRRKVWIPL
jgi:hypothetical protein